MELDEINGIQMNRSQNKVQRLRNWQYEVAGVVSISIKS